MDTFLYTLTAFNFASISLVIYFGRKTLRRHENIITKLVIALSKKSTRKHHYNKSTPRIREHKTN
jgi:hypothetical protein